MNTNNLARGHDHFGERTLNVTDPEDKFELTILSIEWDFLTNSNITRNILNILKQYVNKWYLLNAYACVLGYLCIDYIDNKYEISKSKLQKQVTNLSNYSTYENITLDSIIEKSDIIRYARIFINIRENEDNDIFIVKENEYDEYDENNYNEYDENNYDEEQEFNEYGEEQYEEEEQEEQEQGGDY